MIHMITIFININCWKFNFTMTPHVRPLVGRLDGPPVKIRKKLASNFKKSMFNFER